MNSETLFQSLRTQKNEQIAQILKNNEAFFELFNERYKFIF